jgi:hypothetical protein
MTDSDLIKSLFMVLQQSPSMVNPDGDYGLLQSLARQYTQWAQEVRNKVYTGSDEAVRDLWLSVAQALEERRAYGILAEQLSRFTLVDTYRGDRVQIRVTHRDGRVEDLDGSWLVAAACTLCD